MKIKIISDGTAVGTFVVDTSTGARVDGVKRIQWGVDYDGVAVAVLEFQGIEADIVGDAGEAKPVIPPVEPGAKPPAASKEGRAAAAATAAKTGR